MSSLCAYGTAKYCLLRRLSKVVRVGQVLGRIGGMHGLGLRVRVSVVHIVSPLQT
jgi:hypothetical protein